ncbi:MAG: DUF3991 and TOPRIM domain-containing protein [Clostridia bacterium]|nr:DUF3991 and TOPRIM domain-containing protein [Clostridia bacterium]
MPYIHFSEQEKQMANEADIVSYLHSIGESTERHGCEYWWESPSGKVSIKGSDWYSQYERVGGGAVGFLQKFYGMKYPDAVRTLLGQDAGKEIVRTSRQEKKEKEKKPFAVPPKHTDMRRVYAYLTDERMIDREVIRAFERKGLIFEDAVHHNAVFVGVDENDVPKHIQKRSTNSGSSFKGNVDSSNADYSFNYVGTSDKLFVFEAPIDMLAYITLFKSNWEEHSYVALCSTAECAAVQMLKKHPNITNVYLCLDHDSAGIEGAIRLADILREMGNYTLWRALPKYKDWDEDLKALRGRDAIPSSEHLGLENIKKRCAELLETDVEDDAIYLELLNSKGYLLEQTFGKLRCLLWKIESTEDLEQRRELLFQMANTAVAYCFCRDLQMNNSCGIDKYIKLIKKEYKPYRDKQRSGDQLSDLKEHLLSIEKELKTKEVFTDQECYEQNKKMCRLGMLAIRLDGTIGRERDNELTKTKAQELTM